MAQKAAGKAHTYQLQITLKGIRPPIWRRVQVPGGLTLAKLHDVIQTVFGWTDTHLHKLYIAGSTYGQPDDFDELVEDESAFTLVRAVGTGTKRFLYVYDFGDNWEHDVVVEKIVAGNSGSEGPLCIGGRRRRPPEDCGPRGYRNFLVAIRDPCHEDYDAMLEWVGGSFDPETFDLAAVNRALVALSTTRRRLH